MQKAECGVDVVGKEVVGMPVHEPTTGTEGTSSRAMECKAIVGGRECNLSCLHERLAVLEDIQVYLSSCCFPIPPQSRYPSFYLVFFQLFPDPIRSVMIPPPFSISLSSPSLPPTRYSHSLRQPTLCVEDASEGVPGGSDGSN